MLISFALILFVLYDAIPSTKDSDSGSYSAPKIVDNTNVEIAWASDDNFQKVELSNDSKNEIMLELMKMRHLQEITDEEYRSEVIKLWM